MLRKVSYLLISAVILVAGLHGAKKLRYWERSVWVFKAGDAPERFQRRGGGDRDGTAKPSDRDIRSGRLQQEELRTGREGQGRNRFEREGFVRDGDSGSGFGRDGEPGSGFGKDRSGERFGREDRSFEGNRGERGYRGEHGFHGRKRVSMQNVVWFLAVFASFTVLVIYLEKGYRVMLRRKNPDGNN